MCMPLVAGRRPAGRRSSRRPGCSAGAVGRASRRHGYVLSALGDVHRLAGDLGRRARAGAALGRDLRRGSATPPGSALALNHLGCVERDQRPVRRGRRAPARGAAAPRAARRPARREPDAWPTSGCCRAAAGDAVEGRRVARSALDRGEAVDDGPGVAGALLNLAVVELFAGDPRRRRVPSPSGRSRRSARRGTCAWRRWARLLAAELALDDGDPEALSRHGRAAVELFARLGCRLGSARAAALPLPGRAAKRSAKRLLSRAKAVRRPSS